MTDKRLTVILYGCDRNTWRGGPLDLSVTDIFAQGGPRRLYEGRSEAATMELKLELPFDAGQVYGFLFEAPGHRPAWQLIRRPDFLRSGGQVEVDDIVLRLMLLPDSPGTTDLPDGYGRLKTLASPFTSETGVSAETYQGLDLAAKMAFLNIEAKLRETMLDGTPLISFVKGVTRVAVDRVFVLFDPVLKSRMPRAGEFGGAPGHKAPKNSGLPDHPDSWKHGRFAEGNVQLSFSKEAAPLGGVTTPVHSADVDIDLGKGLAHVTEWLDNHVFKPGQKTNQALVYGLLYAQGILPRYTLDPSPATTRSVAPMLTLKRVKATKARSARNRAATPTAKRKPTRRAAAPRARRRKRVS